MRPGAAIFAGLDVAGDRRPARWLTVWGFASLLGAMAAVAEAGNAAAGAAAPDPAEPLVPPLVTIAEIQAIPRPAAAARGSVRVRGVVTLADLRPAIQDGDHGLHLTGGGADSWASAQQSPATGEQLVVGDEVEIEGPIDSSGYAPRITARVIRRLGSRPLPEPAAADLTSLFGGGDNARRVQLLGVVQGWREHPRFWRLLFECESRSIAVEVPKAIWAEPPAGLVDADVEVIGVVRSVFNTRGEFVAPAVQVARAEDLRVLVPPPAAPFDGLEVPLGEVGAYRQRPLLGHRFRTGGTVSFIVPGTLFLQEGRGGVRVDLAGGRQRPSDLVPGDRVEVAGFLSMSRHVGGIIEAQTRRLGSGPPPPPLAVEAAEIVNTNLRHRDIATVAPEGTYDGCLVRCVARLDGIDTTGPAISLALDADGTLFNALLYEPLPDGAGDPWPAAGSIVAVTGIVEIERDPVATYDMAVAGPILRRLNILLRGPADVAVVRSPSWWTPARLATALGGLAAVTAGAGGWVLLLRREVRRQTAIAVAESAARREAALEYEITLRERNRIAANLHDTVLQSLTGIGWQLKACGKSVPADSQANGDSPAAHLAIADRMVDHAAGQLRGTVWSLRALQADGRPFSEALDDLADALAAGHDARIEVGADPAADGLPIAVTGNLLLVIQEAIHNSLHHAEPRLVKIEAAVDQAAATITVTIADDGRGFATGTEPGPKQGHFGLAGMRERANRLGGTLTIASSPGRGTVVTATAPLDPGPHDGPGPDDRVHQGDHEP
jgi:signal transduction histidine kinase